MALAGQRRHLVTVEQRSSVSSPGYPVATWALLARFYMSREDRSADERFVAAQESAYQYTIWQMRYDARMDPELLDVPATRRLVDSGRTYDVRSAKRVERDTIELMTLAGSAVQ